MTGGATASATGFSFALRSGATEISFAVCRGPPALDTPILQQARTEFAALR